MKKPKNLWSPEDDRRALEMKHQRITRVKMGEALGRTKNAVTARLKLLAMEEKERLAFYASKRVSNAEEPPIGRPTPEMIRDRDVRSMLPHRDLTAAFFNDPPLGLSALDGRRV